MYMKNSQLNKGNRQELLSAMQSVHG